MSRVSNNPVMVPANVEVSVTPTLVVIKGPLGTLDQSISNSVYIELLEDHIKIVSAVSTKKANEVSGTLRALLANMIKGVTEGFEKKLQLVGVGYKAQIIKDNLNLSLGYSHSIDHAIPEGIRIETPSQTEIIIRGIDKQKVGQVAANIRAYRKPEPYKGKGVRYSNEVVVLKETKKK